MTIHDIWGASIMLLAGVAAAPAAAAPNTIATVDGGRYGPVEVMVPAGDIRGYVVFFADAKLPSDRQTATALADEGALVVSVDTPTYLANLRNAGKVCDQLVGDAEMLSRQLQHTYPTLDYMFPILAGAGNGGTLAYAILAQAPNNTLSGAVSVDPTPTLIGAPPLCPGAQATPLQAGGVIYGPKTDLQGFWSVAFDSTASTEAKAAVDLLKERGTRLDLTATVTGDQATTIADLVRPRLSQETAGGLAALPLIELPAQTPTDKLAVVLSGDGGWRDIDKVIAENLQKQGVSVVGWDSLRYFWHQKTPEQTAADLALVLDAYSKRWHADRIALIGYSFGADVMPFAYDRLPAPIRSKVSQVSLLGLEDKADWEITVSGWLGQPPSDAAVPIMPALHKMPAGLIQCFYGEEESESACPSLAADHVELVRTSGGHHFGHDYDGVTRRILDGFNKRAEETAN
jgi:type IV secretory pathway VirJ component